MTQKRQRIAILSVHSSPLGKPGAKDTGGMSIYIREIAPELVKLGVSLDIFTRLHSQEEQQITELAPGARVINLKAGASKDIDKLLIYSHLPDFACNVEGFRKRNELKYNLIFSHYWLSGIVGQILQTWWHTPHVMMFHTLGAVKNALGIGEDEPELRIQSENELVRNCQCLVAATENEKNNLASHYQASPEKTRVIPCGVNMELFQPANKKEAKARLGFDDEKLVLFVGRIEPLKGIENLLRTMPYLQNGTKPRLLIVGGDGHSHVEVNRLKRMAKELDIGDSVTFSGLVDYEKMPGFYRAADVCVVPSFYESFGLVALESLACGTPVVATNVGDLQNIIIQGKTGYVVDENAPAYLADKIARVLSISKPFNDQAQFIHSSVARYSWANTSLKLLELFNELAG